MFKPLQAVLSGLALLLLSACGKELSVDTLGQENNNSTTGSIRMKLDGADWSADQTTYAELTNGRNIAIFGISKNKTSLVFALDRIEVGEYSLNESAGSYVNYVDPNESAIGMYSTGNGNGNTADDGKVIITKIDSVKKTISGTFEFEVFRSSDNAKKTIVQGVIENVSWDPNAGIPSNGGGGVGGGNTGGGSTGSKVFTAKIDGTNFDGSAQLSAISSTGFLNVVASNGTQLISLQFPLTRPVGEYALPEGNQMMMNLMAVSTTPDLTKLKSVESGKLVILENDTSKKFIRGTFEGKMVNDLTGAVSQITAGVFSFTYQ
ncbi:MAG: hypothetical protein EOO02_11930 [Chitinophagaceae bacterium]|nr:MAG: hypothetical protein EOO02_11930 [Chitinophagaceae bacterium]